MLLEDLIQLFKRHWIYFVGTAEEAKLAVVALDRCGVCSAGAEPREWQNPRSFRGAIYATVTGKNWTFHKGSGYKGQEQPFMISDFLVLVNGADPGDHETWIDGLEDVL